MRVIEPGVILQLLASGLAAAVIRNGCSQINALQHGGCFSLATGIRTGAGEVPYLPEIIAQSYPVPRHSS
ncbi:hypothetical protein GA0061070_100445 [Kosakonia oryziphila]|uniref:Uncharacterized protein n=1 Tax=Kosakonia oryziphila TaxID=1005667 RepID=A0A1C4ABB1_9ENTR|nr:hypothetical protein GA0061070_100445 [Kosakonia oryziphila]